MKKIIVFGTGGYAHEVIWLVNDINQSTKKELSIFAFVNQHSESKLFEGYPVYKDLSHICEGDKYFYHIAIGNNEIREKVSREAETKKNLLPITLIHPLATVSQTSKVGKGVFIAPYSIVAPYAEVGNHVLLNSLSIAGHHSKLANFSQLCPGAKLGGYCEIGKSSFVGTNASIAPKVRIGQSVNVGSNSFVFRNVKEGQTVVGVPAKKI